MAFCEPDCIFCGASYRANSNFVDMANGINAMQTLGSNWIIVWCVLFFSLVDKPNQFLDQKKIQGTDSIVVPGATIWIGERIHVVAMDSNWTVPDEDIASLPPEKLKSLKNWKTGVITRWPSP
jgi:hypothetical protein